MSTSTRVIFYNDYRPGINLPVLCIRNRLKHFLSFFLDLFPFLFLFCFLIILNNFQVKTMNNMIEIRGSAKLDCSSILVATQWLLRTLLSVDVAQKNVNQSLSGSEFDLVLLISSISFP